MCVLILLTCVIIPMHTLQKNKCNTERQYDNIYFVLRISHSLVCLI